MIPRATGHRRRSPKPRWSAGWSTRRSWAAPRNQIELKKVLSIDTIRRRHPRLLPVQVQERCRRNRCREDGRMAGVAGLFVPRESPTTDSNGGTFATSIPGLSQRRRAPGRRAGVAGKDDVRAARSHPRTKVNSLIANTIVCAYAELRPMEVETAASGGDTQKPQAVYSREALERELNAAQVGCGHAPARDRCWWSRRRLGQDARHHLPAGPPGRQRRRPAPHPGRSPSPTRRRASCASASTDCCGIGWASARAGCGSGRSTRPARASCASGARRSACARTSSSMTTTIRSGCSRAC
jgi:hypothetical protein